MSNPVRQHYIPKSYLKYFATEKNGEYFSDIYNVRANKLLREQNTSSFCFKKDLYTMDTLDSEKRYFLEKFYASDIDAHFSEILEILTNPNIINITEDQKERVISCLLSLYFRTTKFLHGHWGLMERILVQVLANKPEDEELKFTFENIKYEFKRSEVDSFKAKWREQLREGYIISQLQMWIDFYKRKLKNGMTVYRITGDVKLITSDNPIIIASSVGNRFHLYDPTNIIQIPIDQNHFLFVQPDEDNTAPLRIIRADRDKWFALTNNKQMEDLSERWIISKIGGVDEHNEQQKKYNAPTEENLQEVENFKKQAAFWKIFDDELKQREGNINHPSILALMERYSNENYFIDDLNFKSVHSRLKK